MLNRLKDNGFEVEFTSHAEAIMLHDFPDLLDELESWRSTHPILDTSITVATLMQEEPED